jgi:Tfp pilus assembly protein PilN
MIRVNLLAAGRAGAAAARTGRPRTTWIGVASLVAAILAGGGAWWSVRTDAARLEREIAVAEAELGRLRPIAREAAGVLARKTELAATIASLSSEQAGRFAPVRRLAALGRNVPGDVWLTAVRQRGSQIEIDGRAGSVASVTEFAARIQHAGALTAPVDILSTSAETREGTTLVRFSLRLD